MATKNIGYIAELTGAAQVRTAEGTIRVLNVGDTVSDRDVLITGQGSSVTIGFYSGQQLQVGESTEVLLDETVYAEEAIYTDDQVDQIAALQQAILEGGDVSELDPTAAGVDQGTSASLHTTPVYEREGREGSVETRVTDFVVDSTNTGTQFTGNDDLIDVTAEATISVNPISFDDILNVAEAAGTLNVTGSVGGDAGPGDSVSFTLNGVSYNGTVASDNTFSIPVTGIDLQTQNTFDVTVSGTDAVGNPFSATTTSSHTVDVTAPTVSINVIAGNDVIDDLEDDSVTISGTTTDVEDGQLVTVNVGGTDYTATVSSNNWSVTNIDLNNLTDEANFTVTADVADIAGNNAPQATRVVSTIDTIAPTITISAIATDDIVDDAEDNSVTISGTVNGAEDGQTITVNVAGTQYTTLVSGNTWAIPNLDLSGLADNTNFNVTADVTDLAGNDATQATRSFDTALINEAPVISLSNVQTIIEDDASTTAGKVVATITATDNEDGIPTYTLDNTDNFYAINGNSIELTAAGAAYVNAGGVLPAISVTATDSGTPPLTNTAVATPVTTLVDDLTTLSITAGTVTEDTTAAGDVVATFTVADEDEAVTVNLDNTDGYYAISGNDVVLTAAGKTFLDAGNALPDISLSTSGTSTPVTQVSTVTTTFTDDPTSLSVSAGSVTEDISVAGDVVASFTASDQDEAVSVNFTTGTNTAGYYAISGNDVVLTAAGKTFLDAGNALPDISLSTSGTSTPVTQVSTVTTTFTDDPTQLSVSAGSVTEDVSVAGDVVASFTASDQDEAVSVNFTTGTNTDGYYAISGNEVVLTAAGETFLDAGNALPTISLSTSGTSTSVTATATPTTTSVNDAPVINLINLQPVTEEAVDTVAGKVVATITAIDEEDGTPSFALDNTDGYYTLSGNNVELTAAGANFVNGGGILPAISVTATDTSFLTHTATATPVTSLVNDTPVISLSSVQTVTEEAADTVAGKVVATIVATDEEDGTPSFVLDNTDGYYQLNGNNVELTTAGVNFVNGGGTLPAISVTATDTGGLVDTATATPVTSFVAAGFSLTSNTVITDEVESVQSISVPSSISSLESDAGFELVITGVPTGAALSAGTYNAGSDSWTLTNGDLTGLQITLPLDSSPDYQLSMNATTSGATSTEVSENFSAGLGAFTYADISDPAGNDYARGDTNGGEARLRLGGRDNNAISNISGGFSTSFVVTDANSAGELNFSYRIGMSNGLDAGEWAQVTVLLEDSSGNSVQIYASAQVEDGDANDNQWVSITAQDLGTLAADTYTLTLVGYLDSKNRNNETATIRFDNVSVDVIAPGLDVFETVDVNPAAIALDITAVQNDTDEAVTQLELQGVPVGVVISDGTNSWAGDGASVLDLTGWNLSALTYMPAVGQTGVVTMQLVTTTQEVDGSTRSDSVDVVVGLQDAATGNIAPDAVDDIQLTVIEEGVLANIDVLSNDSDLNTGDVLSVVLASALNGTVAINADGTLTYTPNGNYSGTDTVTYTISDGNGGTDTATFNVVVTPVSDAPDGAGSTVTTNEDVIYTLTVADLGYSDVDGDNLVSIELTSLPISGQLLLSGMPVTLNQEILVSDISAGNLSYQPEANLSGSNVANFDFVVKDDGGTANGGADTDQTPGTINIDVAGVADPLTLSVVGNSLSLALPDSSINTSAEMSQAALETLLNLTPGHLDSFNPDPGVVNDPGNVNVVDGQLSSHSVSLQNGGSVSFDWSYTTFEDTVAEIESGFNDFVLLIVKNSAGNIVEETIIAAAEIAGPNGTYGGTYSYTAPAADQYEFNWLVLNGGDSLKDSGFDVVMQGPTEVELSDSNAILGINVRSGDKDGSETISVRVSNVVNGSLNQGINQGAGVWLLTVADLNGLLFVPDAGFTGIVQLSVEATATEANGDFSTTTAQTIDVLVENPESYLIGTTGNDAALDGSINKDMIYGDTGNDVLSGQDGNDLMHGADGTDTLTGGAGSDKMFGGAGDDTLIGDAGNDIIFGGAGDDSLLGGSDIDILNGGAGNDVLTGGAGSDTFVWNSGDEGTAISPASDVITDFTLGSGGDVLNLADMLQGEDAINLTDYLHFESDGSGGTVINVDADGGSPFEAVQQITLTGVDLTGGGTLSDQQILDTLLADGNLIVD